MADNCYSESRRPCLEPSVDTRALIGGGAVSGMSGHKEPSHANWHYRPRIVEVTRAADASCARGSISCQFGHRPTGSVLALQRLD